MMGDTLSLRCPVIKSPLSPSSSSSWLRRENRERGRCKTASTDDTTSFPLSSLHHPSHSLPTLHSLNLLVSLAPLSCYRTPVVTQSYQPLSYHPSSPSSPPEGTLGFLTFRTEVQVASDRLIFSPSVSSLLSLSHAMIFEGESD